MKKDDLDKTWDNFKKHFTEIYFELKENNDPKNKHVGFVADEYTYQPHVEEVDMDNTLNNLTNTTTSDATNINNLTLTNTKL